MKPDVENQAAGSGPPPSVVEEAIALARRGEWGGAIDKLERRLDSEPEDIIAWLTLAGVRGRAGDTSDEFVAIQRALAIDPYCIPALLLKGNWYEGQGNAVLAATSYTHALGLSPPEPEWPAEIRAELGHARQFVTRHADSLEKHLDRELASACDRLDAATRARWAEAISIRAGKSAPCVSHSNQLHVPRLPAVPFFERASFPFLEMLEGGTEVIREELLTALETAGDESFQPYIAYRPGEPTAQFDKLNHSRDWNAMHLYRNGQPVEANLERCPETTNLLESVSLCDLSGLCPNVFFSALAPKTHIPPHHGESNARVVAHLPLVVPDSCGIRVGFERREWQVGRTLVFDDTIEHEAWNESNALRVVLIFDLWNPLLGREERQVASALARATREFRGT